MMYDKLHFLNGVFVPVDRQYVCNGPQLKKVIKNSNNTFTPLMMSKIAHYQYFAKYEWGIWQVLPDMSISLLRDLSFYGTGLRDPENCLEWIGLRRDETGMPEGERRMRLLYEIVQKASFLGKLGPFGGMPPRAPAATKTFPGKIDYFEITKQSIAR